MAVVSHYDIQPVIDIYGSVQGRDLGAVARRDQYRSSWKRARICRGDLNWSCADRSKQCSLRSLACSVDCCSRSFWLLADRRQLPVVARSVHHHFRAAGGAGRHRLVAVRDPHDAERSGAHRLDHVHGRGDRKQHSGGQLRKEQWREDRSGTAAALQPGFTRFRRC